MTPNLRTSFGITKAERERIRACASAYGLDSSTYVREVLFLARTGPGPVEPPGPPEPLRDAVFSVRVSPAELTALDRQAAAVGQSRGAYIRSVLFGAISSEPLALALEQEPQDEAAAPEPPVRVSGCLVAFDDDLWEEDAEAIMNAIRCLAHVAVVEPNTASPVTAMARAQVRRELRREVMEALGRIFEERDF